MKASKDISSEDMLRGIDAQLSTICSIKNTGLSPEKVIGLNMALGEVIKRIEQEKELPKKRCYRMDHTANETYLLKRIDDQIQKVWEARAEIKYLKLKIEQMRRIIDNAMKPYYRCKR